jgi:hypothetical protein
MVIVAQLVRAPDCGSGGRGFDPHHSPAYIKPRPGIGGVFYFWTNEKIVFISAVSFFSVCCIRTVFL